MSAAPRAQPGGASVDGSQPPRIASVGTDLVKQLSGARVGGLELRARLYRRFVDHLVASFECIFRARHLLKFVAG